MSLTFGLNKSTPENSLNFKPTGNIYFPQPKKAGDYEGCISGVPLGSALWNQEGWNGIGQSNTGQMTLADHMGVWSDEGSPGLSWHIHWPGCHTSPWMGSAHRLLLEGLVISTCPLSTSSSWTASPWREVRTACLHVPLTACITAPEVGDEGVLWGKLLMTDM